MIDLTSSANTCLEALCRASWQGGALALLVWAWCRLAPRTPARVQAWLWRLVVAKFVIVLFWMPVRVPLLPAESPTASLIVESPAIVHMDMPGLNVKPHQVTDVGSYLLAAWIVVAAGLLIRILMQCRHAASFVDGARVIGDPSLLDQLKRACGAMGLRRRPRLLASKGDGSPMAVGVFRPAIVVPKQTLDRLNNAEREMVLFHELAHIRRGDLFWNLLAATVRAVGFFHPLIWLSERRLRLSQEMAADELAIAAQSSDAFQYGQALVSVIAKLSVHDHLPRLSVGVAGSSTSLKERLIAMRLMKTKSVRAMVTSGVLLGVIGIIGVIPWTLVAAEPAAKPEPLAVAADVQKQLAAIRAKIEAAGNGRDNGQREIVDVGFSYLAAHIDDADVAKFQPLAGFTHYAVSKTDNGTYLLVERVDGNVGGLNLLYDPAKKAISSVKFWGKAADGPKPAGANVAAEQPQYVATITIRSRGKGKDEAIISAPKITFIRGQKAELQLADQAGSIVMSIESDPVKTPAEHVVTVKLMEVTTNNGKSTAECHVVVGDGMPGRLSVDSNGSELIIEANVNPVK